MKNQHFESFAQTSSGYRAKALLMEHAVKPEQIFAIVLADVTEALPHLVDGCKYTTEMLCDPDTWSAWLTAERRVAGMCMAYLVRRSVVPLFKHLTPRGGGTAKYRTDPTLPSAATKITKIAPQQPAVRVFQFVQQEA